MRFPISYRGFSKFLLQAIGCGPATSWAQVDTDSIHARIGWSGSVTVPRTSITSIERVKRVPLWLGFGVHGMGGTWALNGSHDGVVRISLNGPARGKTLYIPFTPKTIYLSFENPDEFIRTAGPVTHF